MTTMGFLTSKLLGLNGNSAKDQAPIQPQSILTSRPHSRPRNLDDVMVDAADTAFSAESKLGMATNAVFLDHVRTLADDEENSVRAYRGKKVFGLDNKEALDILQGVQEGKAVGKGDLIITDDYSVDNSTKPIIPQPAQQNTTLPWVLAAALAAGAGVYALNKPNGNQQPTIPAIGHPNTGTGKVTGIGSQIEIVQPKEPK